MNKNLSKSIYWEDIYNKQNSINIETSGYLNSIIKHLLSKSLETIQPKSVLEIGCGNSSWLPYIAKNYACKISGIDYSARGCELAKDKLIKAKTNGHIIHSDIFEIRSSKIGSFDYVYSLGVVEHFTDLENTILKFKEFVNPKGALFTIVPNLLYIYGLISKFYQPRVYEKHVPLKYSDLLNAYYHSKLSLIDGGYKGGFCLDLIAWGIEPRYKKLDKLILPLIRKINKFFPANKTLTNSKIFSPFIYALGIK